MMIILIRSPCWMPGRCQMLVLSLPVYRWNSWGTNMASSFLSSGTWKVVALWLGPRHSDSGATGVRGLLSESPLGESQLLHLVQAPRPAPSPLPYREPVFGDFPVLSDASPQWAMCSLRTVTGLWRHTFPTRHCACNAGLPGAWMRMDTAGCESAVFCILSKWMCFLMNQGLEITNCIVFSFWGLDGREVQHLD